MVITCKHLTDLDISSQTAAPSSTEIAEMKLPLTVTCTVPFHWHLPSLVKPGQDNKNVTFVQRCFPLGQATAKADVSQCIINLAKRLFIGLALAQLLPRRHSGRR